MSSKNIISPKLKFIIFVILSLQLVSYGFSQDNFFPGQKNLTGLDIHTESVKSYFFKNCENKKNGECLYYTHIFSGEIEISNTGVLTYKLNCPKKNLKFKEFYQDDIKQITETKSDVSYSVCSEEANEKKDIYNELIFEELYPGINLRLKTNGKNIEKFFYISPGANPNDIKANFSNIDHLSVSEKNELFVIVSSEKIKFSKPIAYQQYGKKRVYIDVRYKIIGKNTYGFEIGNYDKNKTLIIDPLLTSLHGTANNDYFFNSVKYGQYLYAVGYTETGTYTSDAFIARYDTKDSLKLDALLVLDEIARIYSLIIRNDAIYLTGYNEGYSGMVYKTDLSLSSVTDSYIAEYLTFYFDITADTVGNIYIVGSKQEDAKYKVVTRKLSSELDVIASAELNNSGGNDYGWDIIFDNDTLYLAGHYGNTLSGDYNTPSAESNYFVSACLPDFSDLPAVPPQIISNDAEDIRDIDIISSGNYIYLWGSTKSTNFPAAFNSFKGGEQDGILCKINKNAISGNPAELTVEKSCYIGGSGFDQGGGNSICNLYHNGDESIFVAGATNSIDIDGVVDFSSIQIENNGDYDGFISRKNAELNSDTILSSYIGGQNEDRLWSFSTENLNDSVYLYGAGFTGSNDFPGGGNIQEAHDAFVVMIDNGCLAKDTFNLILEEGELLSACYGNNLTLHSTVSPDPAYRFDWFTNNNQTLIGNGNNCTIEDLISDTVVMLRITYQFGCIAEEEVLISVIDLPQVYAEDVNILPETEFLAGIITSIIDPSCNFISYEFDLNYSNADVDYIGFDLTGTIAEGSIAVVNEVTPGFLKVSCISGGSPFTGSGSLINLHFNSISCKNSALELSNFKYNGDENTNLQNGTVNVVYDPGIALDSLFVPLGKPFFVSVESDTLMQTCPYDSCSFSLFYDAAHISYLNYDMAGTLDPSAAVSINQTSGQLDVVILASGPAFTGKGNLINFEFEALIPGTSVTDIQNFYFNSDEVTDLTNGSVTSIRYGDVNTDGNINAFDAAILNQYIVGNNTASWGIELPWEDWRILIANVDGIPGLSAADVVSILEYAAGIITEFPIEGMKSLITETDVTISQEDAYIIFYSNGNLQAFELLSVKAEGTDVLGNPERLYNEGLFAQNEQGETYRLSLASINEIEKKTPIIRIPCDDIQSELTFNMRINGYPKSHTLNGPVSNIESTTKHKMELYPNPSDGIFRINNKTDKEIIKIKVYNITGNQISFDQTSKDIIDISSQKKGIYFIRILTDDKLYTLKAVVK